MPSKLEQVNPDSSWLLDYTREGFLIFDFEKWYARPVTLRIPALI
jgi:hypothetical protein